MKRGSRKRPRVVESRAQLAALASPVRQEIVDTLEGLGGEAAVADIAAQLGRHADGLYYHLRHLVRAGLLDELADSGDRTGRRYRTVEAQGQRLSLRYRTGAPRAERARHRSRNGGENNTKAVDRVVGALLRVARLDFTRALRGGRAVTEGPRRELWASRAKGWVSAAEIGEINRLLTRLNELLHGPPSAQRDHLVSLAFVLAPVAARPLRREST